MATVMVEPSSLPVTRNAQPRYPDYAPNEETQFIEAWHVVWRNKWSILGLMIVAGVISILYANTRTPLFRASTVVLIEPNINRPLNTQEVYDPGTGTTDYYLTQTAIVRSRDIVAKVVDRLDLASHPDFNKPLVPVRSLSEFLASAMRLEDWLSTPHDKEPVLTTPDNGTTVAALREDVITRVAELLSSNTVPRSQLMRISFVSPDPRLAVSITNATADAYIEYGLETRLAATQRASKWLAEKLGDVRSRLEQSEKKLQTYRDQQQLVNVGGVRTLTEEELIDNARRLRDAQKKKTDLATTYWKVQQAGNDPRKLQEINELFGLALVSSAKANLISAQESLKQLQQRYGEKHPTLAAAETRLQSAQQTLLEQLLQAAQNIRTEFEIARETERVQTQGVEDKKNLIRQMDRKDYDFRVLQREVDTNRQLYDLFLTRFKETDTSNSYETINARVVDPAILPTQPFRPDKDKILWVGLILGFVFGVLLAYLRKLLEQTVHTIDEMESLTSVPVLSVTPLVPGSLRRRNLAGKFIEDPRTPFAEGVRSIRTGIQLSDVDRLFKRILVTSAVPGEGKSSIAATLAIAFSTTERVLLLDADLRIPSVRGLFGQDKKAIGLLELLTGEAKLEECLIQDKASGIYTLSVSKVPPNPTEVISSATFNKLLQTLTTQFDRIIVDSPPVLVASDAMILSRITDATLFLTRADVTDRRAIVSAIKQLRQVQARLIGAVINAVDMNRNSYYRHSHHYAQKYYG
ncbi:MAG: polysaccharide biosynthesis tyrosine autokinase [Pseudomonadota bacterium]